jgi:hypothetical protein
MFTDQKSEQKGSTEIGKIMALLVHPWKWRLVPIDFLKLGVAED